MKKGVNMFKIEKDIPIPPINRKVRRKPNSITKCLQELEVNESFVVPPGSDYSGAQTESPGSFGEAGLDCNCRCTVVSILNVEE